jgi:hypothetical protein
MCAGAYVRELFLELRLGLVDAIVVLGEVSNLARRGLSVPDSTGWHRRPHLRSRIPPRLGSVTSPS